IKSVVWSVGESFVLLIRKEGKRKHHPLRLVGGSNCSGRVEIKYDGSWGTVCDDSWDLKDAQVVCRQLGCGEPASADLEFGGGIGIIWLNKVNCIGLESFLWDCPHALVGLNDCHHKEDAGVTCRDLKLVNGRGPCEGRVEVLRNGQWGTVCGYSSDWDMKDAAVVCRQLGCGEALSAPLYAHFGWGTGRVLMSDVNCKGQESALKDCESRTIFCDNYYDVSAVCSGTGARLVGGSSSCSGRLEMLDGYSWKSICEANFNQMAAEVVCRELDCGVPKKYQGGMFGQGSGTVWEKKIQCRESEKKIFDCSSPNSAAGRCTKRNDVGLVCVPCRLVNGSDSECSGRVELYYDRRWGTVCDRYWDLQDASVLCNQIGCGYAIEAPGQARFGEGKGEIWRDNLHCEGDETDLTKCPALDYGREECTHKNDAGVVCSRGVAHDHGPFRLSGGPSRCEGWVEVYYKKDWARVMMESWSSRDATVVCRQLGCGTRTQMPNSSQYKKSSKTVCLKGFLCSGNEKHLGSCSQPKENKCVGSANAAVQCVGNPRRHGENMQTPRREDPGSEPRLEIFYNGSWGTVCDDSWDLPDANVVCRQLQCEAAVEAITPVSYGPGSGHIWLDDVHCQGNESSLSICTHRGWGQNDCRHKEDVGKFKMLRLTDGCSGQLQVFYNNSWGSVCANNMDKATAAKFCQELGCGSLKSDVKEELSKLDLDPKWLDNVRCRGHEAAVQPTLIVNYFLSHTVWLNLKLKNEPLTCFTEALDLRLVEGANNCSGRLQFGGKWGTVCDQYWTLKDANVLCHQLKCGYAIEAPGQARFGEGSGEIWADIFGCEGSETHLSKCPTSVWERGDCTHANDVICSCNTIQLYRFNYIKYIEILYAQTLSSILKYKYDFSKLSIRSGLYNAISGTLLGAKQ
uniref:Soluble scavenger receptor cysteine-rich domain-containing protein SSC5D n=1 Tax=Erpetoichthys calabaricus TaxID=27687 RepID=A0A8C4TC72_ERPCA